MHLNWVVGRSFSRLQKLRDSLTSVCSWCVDVILHQCMEGASTLIVLLENKTTPCSLSHLWLETHCRALCRVHSTGGVITSIYLSLYQTSPWCLSLIPLLSFTWAEQHLWGVEKVLPAQNISINSLENCVGPGWAHVPLPLLGLGLLFCSAQGKVVLRKIFELCW